MKKRLLSRLSIALAAVALAATAALAGEDPAPTEDVLFMVDGRELHGQIVSESSTEIVFEFVDRVLGLKTKLRLDPEHVSHIKRDVPVKTQVQQPQRRTKRLAATSRPADEPEPLRFGRSQTENTSLDVPALYMVPMKGQMGTDIHRSIYEKVVDDIREHNPDVVIFILDSSEYPDLMIPQVEDPRESRGILMIDEYRELVSMLKDELPDVRQVMWVKDSVGFSSMLALAWDEVYMAPDARFWGLRSVIDRSGADKWSDEDVRAKMSAAISAFVKAFLEYGGHGMELADAMLWPEKKLSASFKGRQVVWALNDLGEFVVDSDDEETLALRAKTAEDLLLSQGTVDSIDDLAFLLGYREYRQSEGDGSKLVDDYVDQWRKVYEQSKDLWADYLQHQRWASGADTVKWLGRCKRDLEQIVKSMERYKAVEVRWQLDYGVNKLALEVEIEKLREQLRALKQGGRGGYGGGGGGFGSGGPG